MKKIALLVAFTIGMFAFDSRAQDATKTITKANQDAAVEKLKTIEHAQLIVEHYVDDDWATARAAELVKIFRRAKHPADYTHKVLPGKTPGIEVTMAPNPDKPLKETLEKLFKDLGVTPTWKTETNLYKNLIWIRIGELDL